MSQHHHERHGVSLAVLVALCAVCLCGCAHRLPEKVRSRPVPLSQGKSSPVSLAGKKVLLVHSYHAEYPWVASITKGVKASLAGTGVELEVFYMDTKRRTSESWMLQAGRLAARKMEEYKPDLVIVSDDNAQQYFAMKYVGSKTPFVFTGVDADPSKYGYPADNITGVIERPQLQASIDLARSVRPIKRIAVLSCDDSTSVAALGFMKEDSIDVEVTEWKLAKDFDDWKAAVARYNKKVDAIVIRSYQALKDPGTGERVQPAEVGVWTAQNAAIPTIAFHDFEIRDGILIGVVKSGTEYGQKAAAYGLQILRGTPPCELPIIRASIGAEMANPVTARRLGIALPDGLAGDTRVATGG